MKTPFKTILLLGILLVSTLLTPELLLRGSDAKRRYSQLVFSFPTKRDYAYVHDPKENRIDIEIRATSQQELSSIERYDETLIRRILVKDLGGEGVRLSLYLHDRDVRAMISDYNEPFRIAIDLFDRNFKEQRDPVTTLPFVNIPQSYGKESVVSVGAKIAGDNLPEANDKIEQPRAPAAAVTNEAAAPEGKRRLLQPMQDELIRPDEMMAALEKQAPGPGNAWKSYPVYIYRLRTDPYKTGKSYETWIKQNTEKALSSSEAMAQYASELFDFGHEGRALIAYQQVLQKTSLVFDKEVMHLWKLAEIHLGQGNLTLADGYYVAVMEKHPDSPLAQFAKLRRIDIKAIRALERSDTAALSPLVNELGGVSIRDNNELSAQILIRKAYWGTTEAKDFEQMMANPNYIPIVATTAAMALNDLKPNVESSWTAFLADTLALNNKLTPPRTWEISTGMTAANYFNHYHGKRTEPFVVDLKNKMQIMYNAAIASKFAATAYTEVVKLHEGLPADLRAYKANPSTIWAIAESYRVLGQPKEAHEFYASSAKTVETGPNRFKSLFWSALTASDALDILKTAEPVKQDQVDRYSKNKKSADKAMYQEWQNLKQDEKNRLYVELKEPIEGTITAKSLLESPARIALEAWDQSLSTEVAAVSSNSADISKSYTPSASTVFLLTTLAKKFKVLGRKDEFRQTKELLVKLKPATFKKDAKAAELWTQELVSLAEEYRQDNQYLQAGRLYALTGRESDNWQGRAEALYKGGLLLYRAGKREEAIQAFQAAAQDGNNLMYADLAKKRLTQLQQ